MSAVVPAIVVVPSKTGDVAYFEAKWRDRDGRQVKRRVGQAWMERDRAGEWRRRRGRTPAGWLDERSVHVAAGEMVERVEHERAEAAAAAERAEAVTFRQVAHEWLAWRRDVKGGAPSTLEDNEILLREPSTPHKRGNGTADGLRSPPRASVPPRTLRLPEDQDPPGFSEPSRIDRRARGSTAPGESDSLLDSMSRPAIEPPVDRKQDPGDALSWSKSTSPLRLASHSRMSGASNETNPGVRFAMLAKALGATIEDLVRGIR